MPNYNPKTQIAYGYVSANDLADEIVHELLFGVGAFDEDYADWADANAQEVADGELSDGDYSPPDERHVTGTHEGVPYESSWLGGALHFFIYESPFVGHGDVASPCVPGAGILNREGTGSVECYAIPKDWWL